MRAMSIILASVLCSSLAHLALKFGADQVFAPMQVRDLSGLAVRFVSNGWIVAGLAMHAVALVAWAYALSMVALSFAYPFISLGFVLVALLSAVFLHEHLSVERLIGTGLIVFGVIMIGRSGAG